METKGEIIMGVREERKFGVEKVGNTHYWELHRLSSFFVATNTSQQVKVFYILK